MYKLSKQSSWLRGSRSEAWSVFGVPRVPLLSVLFQTLVTVRIAERVRAREKLRETFKYRAVDSLLIFRGIVVRSVGFPT